MLGQLNELLTAYQRRDPAARSKLEIFLLYPGVKAVLYHRLAHRLHVKGHCLLARWISQHSRRVTGIEIHPGATIGRRLVIDHGTGIVIGETTIIGNHVKLYQGVTLGALSPRGGHSVVGKRHPTVEDNATIYSGASILGGETVIGANSVIGGNSFLTESVSANTKASVETPKMIFRNKK